MQVTTGDPIGRAPNRTRDFAAGMVLHPEEQREELIRTAAAVRELGAISKKDLLEGLAGARQQWAEAPDGADKTRALGRLSSDEQRLASLPGDHLGALTDALLTANQQRQDRLGVWCKVGVGVALAGFFGSFAIPVAPLQLVSFGMGVAGVATAITASVKRYQTPERDTLSRLAAYGSIAKIHVEAAAYVKALVEGLGAKTGTGIRQTENGVQIGGVIVRRKKS